MDYFKNITPFELARRQEVGRFVSAKRKAICDKIMTEYTSGDRKTKKKK